MHILVTGAKGQLGQELHYLSENDAATANWYFTDKETLDITQEDELEAYFAGRKLDWCINTAAYTAVDAAESDAQNAYRINAEAVGTLARVAARHRVPVIHISTDFVFGDGFYRPILENAPRVPLSVYGKSKAAGEDLLQRHQPHSLTLRTSWLYSGFGKNFVKTMQRLGEEKDTLRVVADQIGTPTYARDLAAAIRTILEQLHPLSEQERQTYWGVYHFSNAGVASWYDFACAVMELTGSRTDVQPIPTAAYPTPAQRPPYSLMDKQKIQTTFGIRLPHWRECLRECLSP